MDEGQTVVFRASGDDVFRVWLDGELILDEQDNCSCYGDEGPSSTARLERGTHRVLAQVGDDSGHWGFVLRLLDERGRPARDIYTALEP